jgi:hypothetical protein
MRGPDDFCLKALSSLADKIGYQEDTDTQAARVALEKLLADPSLAQPSQSDLDDAIERYNDTPEARAFREEDPTRSSIIWAGSRILLARAYLIPDRWTDAADALEDGILYVQARPLGHFSAKELAVMKEIKRDLREWAGVPGLY